MNKQHLNYEISAFFEKHGLVKTNIGHETVFKLNNAVYRFSEENDFATLECARSAEEAKLNMYEDISAYNLKSMSEQQAENLVKSDILEYIILPASASLKSA